VGEREEGRSFEEGGADSCLAGPEPKDKAGLHGGACLVPSCRAPSPDEQPVRDSRIRLPGTVA